MTIKRVKEKILKYITWLLPRDLVYWCAIRVFANASTGKYENQIDPDLTAMDALERWYADSNKHAKPNQQQL